MKSPVVHKCPGIGVNLYVHGTYFLCLASFSSERTALLQDWSRARLTVAGRLREKTVRCCLPCMRIPGLCCFLLFMTAPAKQPAQPITTRVQGDSTAASLPVTERSRKGRFTLVTADSCRFQGEDFLFLESMLRKPGSIPSPLNKA